MARPKFLTPEEIANARPALEVCPPRTRAQRGSDRADAIWAPEWVEFVRSLYLLEGLKAKELHERLASAFPDCPLTYAQVTRKVMALRLPEERERLVTAAGAAAPSKVALAQRREEDAKWAAYCTRISGEARKAAETALSKMSGATSPREMSAIASAARAFHDLASKSSGRDTVAFAGPVNLSLNFVASAWQQAKRVTPDSGV